MIETNTKTKSLNIAVLGVYSLQNTWLYEAFMLLSRNLENTDYKGSENSIDSTSRLRFRFTNQV
jgi:hypothetical protein